MKLTRQGYNQFSLEGLTLGKLMTIKNALFNITDHNELAAEIYNYLSNCNITPVANPDDVNAIKSREE